MEEAASRFDPSDSLAHSLSNINHMCTGGALETIALGEIRTIFFYDTTNTIQVNYIAQETWIAIWLDIWKPLHKTTQNKYNAIIQMFAPGNNNENKPSEEDY